VHFAALFSRVQDNVTDQGSNGHGGLHVCFEVNFSVGQAGHLAAVDFSNVRIDVRQHRPDRFQARDDLSLLLLKFGHAGLHGRLVESGLDGVDHAGNGALDLGERLPVEAVLRPPRLLQAIEFVVVGAHGRRDGLGRNEPFG